MAQFTGIITPIVTPFHRDEIQSINYEATEQLIEYLIAGGVSGLFLLGSNGEFHVMTHEEKIAFARFVVDKVSGRIPVYAGAGSCSTHEAVRLAQDMKAAGVDALSVINPYFMAPSDDELVAYYTTIARSVDVPLIMYNIPKATGKNISKQVVAQLAMVDTICGIKDSSGNMDNLHEYLDAAEGRLDVLVGSDSKILKAIQLGATGAVAGTSNLIPRVLVALYEAASSGKLEEAQQLQDSLEALRDVLHLGTVPSMLKRSMELMGLPVGPARLPASESTPETDEAARKMLAYYGLPIVG